MSVVIVITFLTRLPSVIYKLPELSKRINCGEYIVADDAADPSPVEEAVPVPTTVLITPVDASTLRMRLLDKSEIYKLP
jgi:hypothetical protein